MKISRLYAIFHIDDVYTAQGEKFRKSPAEFMLQLKEQPVDLTARSIVGEGVQGAVLPSATQLSLPMMNPGMVGPVLQVSRFTPFPVASYSKRLTRGLQTTKRCRLSLAAQYSALFI
jgi:hypothetical protein